MIRHERPGTTIEMQGIVDRFGPTAAIIALNQVFTAKFDGFIAQYATAESEALGMDASAIDRPYTQRGITAVTASGTMVHARLHTTPHQADPSAQYLTVVDSIYNDGPAEYWASSARRVEIGCTSYFDTLIDAHQLVGRGPGLRAVETEDMEGFDEQDVLLQQALVSRSLPQLSYGHSGWRYRSDLETYETMHDVFQVRKKVADIHVELGERALRRFTESPSYGLQPTGSDE